MKKYIFYQSENGQMEIGLQYISIINIEGFVHNISYCPRTVPHQSTSKKKVHNTKHIYDILKTKSLEGYSIARHREYAPQRIKE